MKHLIKITFNIMINQQYQKVEHYCTSYEESDDMLTLFDEKKNILCCFKKNSILEFEVNTIDEPSIETKKKKKTA